MREEFLYCKCSKSNLCLYVGALLIDFSEMAHWFFAGASLSVKTWLSLIFQEISNLPNFAHKSGFLICFKKLYP